MAIDLTTPAVSTRQEVWGKIEKRSYTPIEPKVGSAIVMKGKVEYRRGDKVPGYILALSRYCENKGGTA